MPASSLLDNPLLRVSRPVSACSRCRSAKVKCDGKLPACTACEKAGRANECSSASDQFARGKERSYVAALELRVEKLEKQIKYAKERRASMANHEGETMPMETDRKDSMAAIRFAVQKKEEKKQEKADIDSLVSDFGLVSIDATSRDFDPSGSGTAFAKLVTASCFRHALPQPSSSTPPPRQEGHQLTQYYMDNIYALFPCFSETTMWATLDNMYQPGAEHGVKDADRWLFWMVLAIASSAQSHSKNDAYYQNGVEYVARAAPLAEGVLMPGFMATIPSLILLSQYSMYDPTHFDSWHCVGFATRVILEMGLHQDPPSQDVRDRADLDMRRKMFHCAYALDRAVSMGHARPFSFTDWATNVLLPASTGIGRIPSISGHITGPQSSNPFMHLFQLRRLQSGWYQTLYQSGDSPIKDDQSFLWKSCHDLREWSESLPHTLPSEIRRAFNLELEWSYVYVLMPCARAPHMTEYRQSLTFEHAIGFIDGIHAIAYEAERATPFTTYYDVMRTYFIGSQLVAVLRDAFELLVSGRPVTMPHTDGGSVPAPPMPHRYFQAPQYEDNLQRSLKAMRLVRETLTKFGDRWEDSLQLLRVFQQVGAEMQSRLEHEKLQRELQLA